jgi:hypothetical protein
MHNGTAYVCDVCDRRFDKVRVFEQHRLGHDEAERPFACTVDRCTKRFKMEQTLRLHNIHVHEKARAHLDARQRLLAEQTVEPIATNDALEKCIEASIAERRRHGPAAAQLKRMPTVDDQRAPPFACTVNGCAKTFTRKYVTLYIVAQLEQKRRRW